MKPFFAYLSTDYPTFRLRKGEGQRRFQIFLPKTIKGIRKIPLTSKATYALRKQKEYMLKHGMIDNHIVDGYSGFVFLTKKFQLWSVVQLDIILHKIVYDYNSIEVAAGILKDRESLRHTACTRMAEAGMDQRTLQEIMGHSNLAITMKVYNHVLHKGTICNIANKKKGSNCIKIFLL